MLKSSLSEFESVSTDDVADIYIVNSCTVTEKADQEAKQAIRRFKKKNPNAAIVITGCSAQTRFQEWAKMEGIDFIVGNTLKHKIPEILNEHRFLIQPKLWVQNAFKNIEFQHSPVQKPAERTRFFLKIQDGCNDFCTFCVIPYARGKSRSLAPDRVIDQIRTLIDADVKEVVLTGVSLGSYGADLSPKVTLAALVRRIENETKLLRLRISSLEPEDVSDELLSVLRDSVIFCPHFHLPLQSGDDFILEKMKRNYSVSYYEKLIRKISNDFKDVFIGIDLICGFPYETEERFHNSCHFLESIPWSKLHVFPYSSREGTSAVRFPEQVKRSEIGRRAERLREMSQRRHIAFLENQVGKKLSALVEKNPGDGPGDGIEEKEVKALSRNYVSIVIGTGKLLSDKPSIRKSLNEEIFLIPSAREGEKLVAL